MAGPLVAVVMLTGACSGEPPEVAAPVTTLSTTSTTVTSTVPSTTSTSPTTTTTTTTTTTLVIPDGIPEEAFARVGAPYPEFDTTFPDGFDAEAWLRAYEEWNKWALSNPDDGIGTLGDWVSASGAMHAEFLMQLGDMTEKGWTWLEATELQILDVQTWLQGEDGARVVLLSQVSGQTWIVDGEEVIAAEDFDGTPPKESGLVLVKDRAEGRWLLEVWR